MGELTPGEPVYIGVDLTAGVRAITHVALNQRLRVVARAQTDFDGAVAAVTAYTHAVCAVDAPQTPNAGLMADPAYRAGVGLPPNGSTYCNYKVCEYELRRRGIGLYNTPRDADRAPAWMHLGWRFYAALAAAGFAAWPEPGARQVFEVHPHACFTTMLAHRPLRKLSMEGRMQRQMALCRAGVGLPNPLELLEEITPHRLLTGDLDTHNLLWDHDALDAAAAAYTAWLAATSPAQVTRVGDPAEGVIVVPTAELANMYPKGGRGI